MTIPVTVAPRAAAWIKREAAHFERPTAAARFIRVMEEAMQILSEHPRSSVVGLIPGTRTLIKDNYRVTYRIVLDRSRETLREVQIIAIRSHFQADARRPRR